MNIILGNRDFRVYIIDLLIAKPTDIKQGRPGNEPRFDVHGFSPGVLKVGKGMYVKSISFVFVVASKGMGSVYTS